MFRVAFLSPSKLTLGWYLDWAVTKAHILKVSLPDLHRHIGYPESFRGSHWRVLANVVSWLAWISFQLPNSSLPSSSSYLEKI
jgi:hypothetical protein